jgi:glucokinase
MPVTGQTADGLVAEGGLCLGIDVGGTKIAAGLVAASGELVHASTQPVAGRGETAVEQIAEVIAKYAAVHPIDRIGVGVPGGVDPVTRAVRSAPNLGWAGLPLSHLLGMRFGTPVYVENDANAAAWAEHRFGAGRGGDTTVLVTVGTGIGGGLVINGELIRGEQGLGGELGHLPLLVGGRGCVCGARGCWEQYASGSALTADAIRRRWRTPPFAGEEILAAAEAGDQTASDVTDTVAAHLAHGLTILGAALDPSCFILGGGLGTDGRFIRRVNEALGHFRAAQARTRIAAKAAQLGASAGLIGAADLARGHAQRPDAASEPPETPPTR